MLHAADNIECPSENLKPLLKVSLMSKISVIYDDTIDKTNVSEDVVIMCINCGKKIGCLLDNQDIENFSTNFVTNMVLHNFGLFWIIQSNKNLIFDFKKHCNFWILNGPCYNTTICSLLNGLVFEDFF